MLFERIRRTQKPIFIFLAVMFGLGFVALGVGQGVNGVDLGGLFNSGSGSSGPSISSLSSRVQSHPKDANAWLQLARANETAHKVSPAISAYQTYVALRPKNTGALSATATLLEQRGAVSAGKAQGYRAAAAAYTQVNNAIAAQSLKLGAALTHPLITILAQPAQTIGSTYETSAITDYAQAMSLRQKVVKLQPKNANDQILLARDAYATQSYGIVATALQAYVTLSPNLTKAQRKQLQQQIIQFQLLAKSSSSGSGTAPIP